MTKWERIKSTVCGWFGHHFIERGEIFGYDPIKLSCRTVCDRCGIPKEKA